MMFSHHRSQLHNANPGLDVIRCSNDDSIWVLRVLREPNAVARREKGVEALDEGRTPLEERDDTFDSDADVNPVIIRYI
jgi:hypothetical protein